MEVVKDEKLSLWMSYAPFPRVLLRDVEDQVTNQETCQVPGGYFEGGASIHQILIEP